MKAICITILYMLALSTLQRVCAQEDNLYPKEEIIIRKSFLFGPTYFQGKNRLRTAALRDTIKSNPKAYNVYKTSVAPKAIGNVFSFTGGFILGWQLASASKPGGGDILPLLASGALILSGGVFDSYANKTRSVAIGIYNKDLQNGSTFYMEQPQLIFTGNGICLTF